ncbi:hypothetical protein I547_0407 [Mycobacterium kansasii 824]|nr:hypothetical protein I547_0407 [Mycobacterium kansasii 824]
MVLLVAALRQTSPRRRHRAITSVASVLVRGGRAWTTRAGPPAEAWLATRGRERLVASDAGEPIAAALGSPSRAATGESAPTAPPPAGTTRTAPRPADRPPS